MKATGFHPLDLCLPSNKTPSSVSNARVWGLPVEHHVPNYAVGSSSDGCIVRKSDRGTFDCVYECWRNHWNLRTTPEDWWMPIATKVAKAIDTAAKREGENKDEHEEQSVRKLFVNHEDKKNLCVDLDVVTIDQVDYEDFFDQMSCMISTNMNNADFVSTMQNDFSTSGPSHKISSQVNLMASMQEFFSYEMGLYGCGIKGIEMLGTQDDWDSLVTKFQKLRTILKPIQDRLGYWDFRDEWWDHVEMVYGNLAKTYGETQSGKHASKEIADFWMEILMEGEDVQYGPSGMDHVTVDAYSGWLIMFFLGKEILYFQNFWDYEITERLNGLNDVPMTITRNYLDPPISEEATLVAGVIGYEVHVDDTFNSVPSVQPHHMWAMTLPRDSSLRRK